MLLEGFAPLYGLLRNYFVRCCIQIFIFFYDPCVYFLYTNEMGIAGKMKFLDSRVLRPRDAHHRGPIASLARHLQSDVQHCSVPFP